MRIEDALQRQRERGLSCPRIILKGYIVLYALTSLRGEVAILLGGATLYKQLLENHWYRSSNCKRSTGTAIL